MESWHLKFALHHRVPLDDADPYLEVIQQYSSRIIWRHGEEETLAGTFDFHVANVELAFDYGIDIVRVADAIDGDMYEYCEALFEPGTRCQVRDEVAAQFEYPVASRVLMLHLAKVLPEFRGKRLALVAAHKIVQQFGDGLVVAKAQPLQHHSGFRKDAAMKYDAFEADEDLAMKRLTRHWQRLGFKPIVGTDCLGLNTAFKLPVPKLRRTGTSKRGTQRRTSTR